MGITSDLRDALLSQPKSFKKKKEYTLEELLGRGGFGKVVRATWRPPGGEQKEVALKIVPKKLVKDPSTIMDEINVLKNLDNPHIVHVWDHFESRDKYYIAFELAIGGELFDRITERGRFTEKDAGDCIRQVLEATAYLHQHQIVHRDLKPENILFKTRDPVSPIVIADFGIAKHLEPDEEITSMAGSFGYAAPEVLLGKPHSYPVDLWSTGVIAYTLLCGYSPFRSDDKAELIRETTRGKVTFHDRFWKHVSEPAKDFIRRLLVVDPRQRLTAQQALQHPWIVQSRGAMKDDDGERADGYDLSGNIRENFNPRKKWNDALNVIMASNALKNAGRRREQLDSDSSEDGYATADSARYSDAVAANAAGGAGVAGAASGAGGIGAHGAAIPGATGVGGGVGGVEGGVDGSGGEAERSMPGSFMPGIDGGLGGGEVGVDVARPHPAVPLAASEQASAQAQAQLSVPGTPTTPTTPNPTTPGTHTDAPTPPRTSSGFGLANLVNSLKAQKL